MTRTNAMMNENSIHDMPDRMPMIYTFKKRTMRPRALSRATSNRSLAAGDSHIVL